ncbi:MAG: tRNA pseudouridine(13) synthase TruD [Methylococcaceae bacterium]|nr:tRNA pseudouridine(13) synthase TruD [Methylococcaceae bacterium]
MTVNQTPITITIPTWRYATTHSNGTGSIKTKPADFIVKEQLSFQPEGTGEHAFIQIQKTGENTEYIARLLARFSGVRQRDVSYAGLKDRHAVTTQWFSIWLPGKSDPDWKKIETEGIKVLQTTRHARKLKRGVLAGNKFQIVIRDWQGDKDELESQLQLIKQEGIPNYFGSQRFGIQGNNVNKALALFQGAKVKREQRGIYLSSVRSYLFNYLLSERVKLGIWNQGIEGDVFIFDQSRSYFKSDHLDSTVLDRVKKGEIHPAGLMVGKGDFETTAKALAMEESIVNTYKVLVDGLVKFDVKANRRAFRVLVNNLQWEFQEDSIVVLNFFLPSGSFATALLRELINN